MPALKLAVGLITYVLPTLVADNAAPAKEEVNELKSIVSPSVSLNVKVTKVLPGLAPLVFWLAVVSLNVIVGATLSVILTVNVALVSVPKSLDPVISPDNEPPPTSLDPDIFLATLKYPLLSTAKSAVGWTDQVTGDWFEVNWAVVPVYPELSS